MKKETKKLDKKTIIIIIIAFILIVGTICYLVFKKDTYVITFNTDGGNVVSAIKIKEDETLILPENPTKEGYLFSYWANENNEPISNGTKITKDLTLKAIWISDDAETITITFDSKGGSNVSPITIEKGTVLKLPTNPTRKNYTFVTWEDKNGTPIYDDALLDGDITLYAVWKASEKDTTEEKPQVQEVTYSCPSGYTLKDTKCIKEESATTTCPEGTFAYENKCVTVKGTVRKNSNKVCSTKTIITSVGHTSEVQGVLTTEGLATCYYYKYNDVTSKTACDNLNHVWSSTLNGCYTQRDTDYTTSCDSGYVYLASPNSYSGVNGVNSGCFPLSEKSISCNDGFTYNSTSLKCVKTIDATKN